MNTFSKKKLVVFDLDGTLALSKAAMDKEMDHLMTELLKVKKVAVIGGGKYELFKMQLVSPLTAPKALLSNLFLFPTTSAAFYRYDRGWKQVYRHLLSKEEIATIRKAFKEVFAASGYVQPKKVYGKVLENRGTQVTFSALGQNIVEVLGKNKGGALKEKWKSENTAIKMKMAKMLAERLPKLEVHAAGFTSIDVTRKGIDKAYGLHQIEKQLHIPIKDMVFIGDALFPGGNDHAVKKTGVQAIPVRDPEDTKRIIRKLIAS